MRLTDQEMLSMLKELVILARRSEHPDYRDGCAWCAVAFNRAAIAITDLQKKISNQETAV